jgi:hypothetical protein
MPSGDGTGPWGLGPGTGRGKGWCKTGFGVANFGRSAFRGKNKWLVGLAAPLVIAAIRDLASPTGFLRQLSAAFLSGKRMKGPPNIRRDAEYSVLDQPSAKPDRKKKQHHDAERKS